MNDRMHYKVVFQLSSDDNDVYRSLIKQLNNLFDAIESVIVEVAINARGIGLIAKDSLNRDDIKDLIDRGVSFLICNNTLKGSNKTVDDLITGIEVIPAVVAHLVRRQHEGWAYIKAGF